ncbi:rCG27501 [Rattus norvegicus]|uniref:RCG27501 n=1 Tax=Rattus norvegicus TaxID=10116 RepID=A6K735_RAT|nr:rCG27501 [Rattus norvegicus]
MLFVNHEPSGTQAAQLSFSYLRTCPNHPTALAIPASSKDILQPSSLDVCSCSMEIGGAYSLVTKYSHDPVTPRMLDWKTISISREQDNQKIIGHCNTKKARI